MIGDGVILFNQRGVRLKSVILTGESISLKYGSEKQEYLTKIICNRMEKADMKTIAEKFLYETGISPQISE